MNNMKLIFIFLLVTAAHAYTPINERSWINFQKVKDPTYVTVPVNEEVNIIRAKRINLEERINTVATLVQKSIQDFQKHMQKYTTDITGRIKRATQVTREYGFVRKPELWHQYGMLFNHHGQVISG